MIEKLEPPDFDEFISSIHEFIKSVRNAAITECRNKCLSVGKDAREAARSCYETDYVSGYQDAAVDCDEELRLLISKPIEEKS